MPQGALGRGERCVQIDDFSRTDAIKTLFRTLQVTPLPHPIPPTQNKRKNSQKRPSIARFAPFLCAASSDIELPLVTTWVPFGQKTGFNTQSKQPFACINTRVEISPPGAAGSATLPPCATKSVCLAYQRHVGLTVTNLGNVNGEIYATPASCRALNMLSIPHVAMAPLGASVGAVNRRITGWTLNPSGTAPRPAHERNTNVALPTPILLQHMQTHTLLESLGCSGGHDAWA